MKQYIDVFNGDADGIFALIQWRKAYPVVAENQRLITGVKRDNALIKQVTSNEAEGATLTVLDISFDKNTTDLERVLNVCESVFYCDHHRATTLFEHDKLTFAMDSSVDVCTATLVNDYLVREGKVHNISLWAVAAAYGDGLDQTGMRLAAQLGLDATESEKLKRLGVLVNYNGYGASVEDLHFSPADLYRQLFEYDGPFEVIEDPHSPYSVLNKAYETDLDKALHSKALVSSSTQIAVSLDNAAWARRISGTYGNKLAAENPSCAIVITSPNADGTLTVSLRAPKNDLRGAGDICSAYATGGGREGAAGVNKLPEADLAKFLESVNSFYANKA